MEKGVLGKLIRIPLMSHSRNAFPGVTTELAMAKAIRGRHQPTE